LLADLDPSLKTPIPSQKIRPMYPSEKKEPFNKRGWLFEPKLDGFRGMVANNHGRMSMYSRGLADYTGWFREAFTELEPELRELGEDVLVDGEVVLEGEDGRANFNSLRRRQLDQGTLRYYIFDILYARGYDLKSLPLRQRKEILAEILPTDTPRIRQMYYLEGTGIALYIAAAEAGFEGIVGKDEESIYTPPRDHGETTKHWIKTKHLLRGWWSDPTREAPQNWDKLRSQAFLLP
jgi:bifunctional non-homologous end joining protein LigD